MLWTRLEYCKLLKLVLWVQPTLEQPQNINLKVVDWQCIAETKIFGERTAITIETNLERIIFLTLFSNINGTMDSPGPETRRSIRATKKFGDMPTYGFLSWSWNWRGIAATKKFDDMLRPVYMAPSTKWRSSGLLRRSAVGNCGTALCTARKEDHQHQGNHGPSIPLSSMSPTPNWSCSSRLL